MRSESPAVDVRRIIQIRRLDEGSDAPTPTPSAAPGAAAPAPGTVASSSPGLPDGEVEVLDGGDALA